MTMYTLLNCIISQCSNAYFVELYCLSQCDNVHFVELYCVSQCDNVHFVELYCVSQCNNVYLYYFVELYVKGQSISPSSVRTSDRSTGNTRILIIEICWWRA